ncbi:hypothetical protein WJX77_004753 [Trebouxia sp. C0004]
MNAVVFLGNALYAGNKLTVIATSASSPITQDLSSSCYLPARPVLTANVQSKVSMVTVAQFIDSREYLTAGSKADLKSHV